MEIKNFFINAELEKVVVGGGIVRKNLSYNENIMICQVNFSKGSIGNLHAHVHEQCTYIVSGKFEVVVGNEKKIVSQGDSVYIQKDILHGIECIEEGVVLDIFTPMRKDFI